MSAKVCTHAWHNRPRLFLDGPLQTEVFVDSVCCGADLLHVRSTVCKLASRGAKGDEVLLFGHSWN